MTAERRRVLQMLHDHKIGVDDAEGLLDALESEPQPVPRQEIEIISTNPKVHRMLDQAKQIAQSNSTVLIVGEPGTGKELIARSVHQHSRRHDNSFVVLNIPGIPEVLLESELFGHEKGAFTGAVQLKRGCLESADGGTIFLDEIAQLPAPLQVKLLRFLETGEVVRMGGTIPTSADVRLIACTSKDLEGEVESGRFLEDLYYRLKAVMLESPPLRECKDDIVLLVDYFLARLAARDQHAVPKVSPEALEILRAYDWPGNVRELRNAIEGASVLCRGDTIQVEHLPELRMTPSLAEVEHEAILQALQDTNGDKPATAQRLGVSLPTLYRKLEQLDAEQGSEGDSDG